MRGQFHWNVQQTKQNNEMNIFWDIFEYLVTTGVLEQGYHYKIWCTQKLKTDKYNIETMKKVIAIDMKMVLPEYMKYGRMSGQKILPASSLEFYLKNTNEYLGMTNCRFKYSTKNLNDKSEHTHHPGHGDENETEYSTVPKWCFHFDYDKLPINIETELTAKKDL